MTAMRVPDPAETPAAGSPASPTPRPRRAGSVRSQASAAGQQRRSLQRDLARREAALRISRRASGPAGGIARAQSAAPAAPTAPAVRQPAPVQRQAAPAAAPRQAPAPRPQPAIRQPAARQQQPARPAAPTRPQPARGVDLRRAAPAAAPQPAAFVTQPATQAAATAAAMRPQTVAASTAPAPAPARTPLRPFVVLPGGATEAQPGQRRRLSTPAVVLSALVAIVLTVGLIVAAQIRVTQMNERIGTDLGEISQLQQATVAQKERISSLVTSARIDDEAARQQLIEPDPVDVTYLSTGDRAKVAERAARILRQQPVNPAGGPTASATDAAAGSTGAAGSADAATATSGTATTGATATTTTTGTTTP